MKKALLISVILTLLFPAASSASVESQVIAAFIRNGDVWILQNNKEKQITNSGNIHSPPKWSKDGTWLAYQVEASTEGQSELWTYNLKTRNKKRISDSGHSAEWAPHKNHLSYIKNGILDISDLNRFYNIATGVSDYTWLPDGSGFLLSSSGTLNPDGWSSASLFIKKVGDNYEDIVLFGGVKPFFTLPREIGTNDQNKLIAVYAEQLTYSPSGKWISFVVSPTASWSMDSNMVCAIDKDGKNFEVLDEMILDVGQPKWSPSTDTLAYIAGGGRIVFGFKNKDLKVKEMPVSGTYTPAHYADLDFDWMSDKTLVVSRLKEQAWTNDFSKHPLPALYTLNMVSKKQIKITSPPEGFGDYAPQYIPSIGKLVWLRGTSLTDMKRDLWIGNPDGAEAGEWIRDVEKVVFYTG
ncbi:PD40 domain-containing protein [Bacillus sp. NTK074B]|uniref:PD40 domain-containing protein n=1 Tax=Bacillus sp. NTK074B TaxID=2802174 RepID=UPI001A8F4926|nr:PD40 domain-containing protein [Bacillus sp. NTK074B]